MKRLGLLVVLMLLLISTVALAEPQYVTLEEAMGLAMENSISLQMADIGVKEASLQYRQAEAAMIMQPSPVTLMQAQVGLDLARQNYLMEKDNLALTVQSDFYNVLKLMNMVEIAEEALDSSKRHEEVSRQKLAAGTATKLDVIKASGKVSNSQSQVTQAKHGLELAILKLRQTLGLALDNPIYPNESEFEYSLIEIDLADDLAFALANREEIKQLAAAVEIARQNVALSDNDYTPLLTLEQAQINLAKMEEQLRQVRQLLELEIRQSYSSLVEGQERIGVLEKGMEEAEEMARLSQLMYDANMITGNDLQDARLAVLAARNDLVSAITDYNLAKARYFHGVTRVLRQ